MRQEGVSKEHVKSMISHGFLNISKKLAMQHYTLKMIHDMVHLIIV